MKNKIITIQSRVVYGYVGSNISDFVIQLHGYDVISFPSVYLASHTGNKPIFGDKISQSLFSDFIKGIANLKLDNDVVSILSGYIGSTDIQKQTADMIYKLKEKHNVTYILDPVMGDTIPGFYVSEEVCKGFKNTLLPLCDILTPNQFEFEYLISGKINTTQEIIEGYKSFFSNDQIAVVTGCFLIDTPCGHIDVVICHKDSIKRISSPYIPLQTTGTGDLFSSILTALISGGKTVDEAVELASMMIGNVMKYLLLNNLKEVNAMSILNALLPSINKLSISTY